MEIEIKKVTCAECMVMFWIASGHMDKLRDSHETFYCPSGHAQSYPQKTDAEKAIEELSKQKKENERMLSRITEKNNTIESLRRSIIGHKGAMASYKKRVRKS